MMKKEYCAPELEVIVLEQKDIITASAPGNRKPVTDTAGHKGQWDTWA